MKRPGRECTDRGGAIRHGQARPPAVHRKLSARPWALRVQALSHAGLRCGAVLLEVLLEEPGAAVLCSCSLLLVCTVLIHRPGSAVMGLAAPLRPQPVLSQAGTAALPAAWGMGHGEGGIDTGQQLLQAVFRAPQIVGNCILPTHDQSFSLLEVHRGPISLHRRRSCQQPLTSSAVPKHGPAAYLAPKKSSKGWKCLRQSRAEIELLSVVRTHTVQLPVGPQEEKR